MRQQTTGRERQPTSAVMAGVMLVLWLGMSALALSPHLHHWLHHDSDRPDHQCVVGQLNKGLLVDVPANAAAALPAPFRGFSSSPTELFSFSDFDHRVSLSRAPPASSFFVAVVG